MKNKRNQKMFEVTIIDEMSESTDISVSTHKDLLKLIKEYTSAKSLDSTPLYSINFEILKYNESGVMIGVTIRRNPLIEAWLKPLMKKSPKSLDN